MIKNSKSLTVKKLIIYSLVAVFLFFGSLETIQRVRYFFRFQSKYWLFYGFTNMPANYAEMLEKGLIKRFGTQIIKVPPKIYDERKGYRKYEPNLKTPEYNINSFGFRGKEFDINKKANAYRIVALGGSTTFGADVGDGFTYPDYLQRALDAISGMRYEVINGGINGSTIDEIEGLLEGEVIKLKPDMLILSSVFNNFYYNNSHMYKYRENLLQKINTVLMSKSLLYMTLREKMASVSGAMVEDVYKAPLEATVNDFLKDDKFWSDMKTTFKDIARITKDNNIMLVIIKEPIWLRDYKQAKCGMLLDKRFEPVYKKAYMLLDDIAKEEHLKVIDIAGYFDPLPNKDTIFIDGLHLTKKGNEYMGELIAKDISGDIQ